ncbi:MAG: efflux RND transporter periplasmic adaptor subunit, partial [Ignavibacteria bacterium]|nr:efflux RND transporter periplasmic adaptor subunit [Ignavibacteria bacterium]
MKYKIFFIYLLAISTLFAQKRAFTIEDLYKLKSISESKLIESRYEVESIRQRMETAQAELQLAQSNLTKTTLVAPSDGVLAQIIVQPGEFVTPNDVVARFVSSGDANFEVDVPEKDVNQLKIGLNARVFSDSYPDKVFNGLVSEIAPMVKERTRTVTVKIRLPNEEGILRSGMFARGEILVIESSNTIAVNGDSVISLGGDVRLLPILKPIPDKQGQGMIEFRQIKVGQNIGKSIVVLDGVQDGEFYVTETSGELT